MIIALIAENDTIILMTAQKEIRQMAQRLSRSDERLPFAEGFIKSFLEEGQAVEFLGMGKSLIRRDDGAIDVVETPVLDKHEPQNLKSRLTSRLKSFFSI